MLNNIGIRVPVSVKVLLKLVISAAFVAVVLFKVDMRATADAMASIHAGWYGISFLLLLMNSLVLAVKFKVLIKPSGIRHDVVELFRINLICRFYAFFLTPAVGQGVIRWYRTTRRQPNHGAFIPVLLLERASFIFVLCAAVFLLQHTRISPPAVLAKLMDPVAVIGMVTMALLVAYLFAPPLNKTVKHMVGRCTGRIPAALAEWIGTRLPLFDIYLSRSALLIQCLGAAVVWHSLYLLRVYLLLLAIDTPLAFVQISWMASLVLLIQMMPITLNGIGLRESAYAFLFGLEALPPEKGVLLGLLFLSQMLMVAAIGGVLAMFDRTQQSRELR